MTTDLDRDQPPAPDQRWADVGGHRPRRVVATIAAATIADVQQTLAVAAAMQLPLSVVSTGWNWGLGSRWPIYDGCYVLDLSAMNHIRALDLTRGVAIIEPGVTQRQLARALDGSGWMINATSSCADSSIVGNAMDRGDGTYRPRSADVLGLEAVLADGSILTTGGLTPDGGFLGRPVGPDLTQAFVQANLGVVTAMAIALIAIPTTICLLHATLRGEAAPAAAHTLGELVRRAGGGLGMPRVRDLHLSTGDPAAETAGQDRCTVLVPLAGPMATVDHVAQLTTAALSDVDTTAVVRCVDAPSAPEDDPVYARTLLARGIPTCQVVRAALRAESCDVDSVAPAGLLTFLPMVALDGESIRAALQTLQHVAAGFPGAVAVEMSLATAHTAHLVVQIGFDRRSPTMTQNAHRLRDAWWRAFAGRVYRSNIDHSPWELLARGGHDAAVIGALKNTVDPGNIIAPGRFTPTAARPS